jgi:hypothetical protein
MLTLQSWRFNSFQPDGKTAAASEILMMSPGMNFSTVANKVIAGEVFITNENHNQPAQHIND